jgi:hypothetical protein
MNIALLSLIGLGIAIIVSSVVGALVCYLFFVLLW